MTAAIPNPPLTPSDGRGGLLPLAEQLAQAIDLKWGGGGTGRAGRLQHGGPDQRHPCLLWHPQLLADIAARLESSV